MSCSVSGPDNSRWTAFFFGDNHFEPQNDNYGSVETYQSMEDSGMRMDPLCRGRYDANKPEWDPREYWLRILESQLRHYLREWKKLTAYMESYVETNVRPFQHPAIDPGLSSSSFPHVAAMYHLSK